MFFLVSIKLLLLYISFQFSQKILKENRYQSKKAIHFLCISIALYFSFISKYQNSVELTYLLLQSCILFTLALQDAKTKEVSVILLILLFIVSIGNSFHVDDANYIDKVFALLIGTGMLLLINVIQEDSVGSGDVYCIGIMGLYYGVKYLFVFMTISYFIAFFYSLYLCLYKKGSYKSQIPMFPFFYIGYLCTLLFRI